MMICPRESDCRTSSPQHRLTCCRYRWPKEYGGLKLDQAKRLKELELENTRLKRIVAGQRVNISILKEVAYPES